LQKTLPDKLAFRLAKGPVSMLSVSLCALVFTVPLTLLFSAGYPS
jgi:hypothetical protein